MVIYRYNKKSSVIKMKKTILFILLLLLPITVYAKGTSINNMVSNIEIDEDNNITINEDLDVSFNNPNSKLNKKIDIKEYDIKKVNISSDYKIKDNQIVLYNKDNLNYKISLNYFLERKHKFNKKTNITLANNYSVPITKSTYFITLPKDTETPEIEMYLNDKRIDLDYKMEDNKITITYNEELAPDDILEIRINNEIVGANYLKLTVILSLVFVIISYILWFAFGKDKVIKIKYNNDIPDLNPIDMGLLYHGTVTKKDVYNLILYLANKGYLKIEEHNRSFTITKGKEYDGKNYYESLFIKHLFRKNIVLTMDEYVKVLTTNKRVGKDEYIDKINEDDLKIRIKSYLIKIEEMIKTDKKKYFESYSFGYRIYFIFMVSIILILLTSYPIVTTDKFYLFPIPVIISVMTFAFLYKFVDKIDTKGMNLTFVIQAIIIFSFCWILFLNYFKLLIPLYIISYVVSCISVLLILLLYKFMPKRTAYGTKIMGRTEGYKMFVRNADFDEIRAAYQNNNNYYYDSIPYLLLMNIEDNLFNKYKLINIKEPKWYIIEGDFTLIKFMNSIRRLEVKITEEE